MFKQNFSIFKLVHTNFFNFATKMRQGATKKTKDSAGRRLGIKTFGGHEVFENQILVLFISNIGPSKRF
jgi:large subunit ribosomal protein L27